MLTFNYLEWMNGVQFSLYATVVLLLGLYIWLNVDGHEDLSRSHVQVGISLFIMLLGDAVTRGWIWWWRHGLNVGRDVAWMVDYPVLVVGTALSIIGTLCFVRVFSMPQWGRWAWAVCLVVVALSSGFFAWV